VAVPHDPDHSRERRERWRRAAPFIAPALLAGVALIQIVRVHTGPLTAWKGGGFGMFSTVERPEIHLLRCFAVEGTRERALPVPPALRRDELRALGYPTHANLLALGRRLAATGTAGGAAVRVELWRRDLFLDTGTVRVVRVDEATYRAGEGT
jgi:hypothetical protein